ncbi:MAG: D-TA family PLP-dependent enzyme [Bacteroidota bacterium]
MQWYEVSNIDEIDSPALLVFSDRIQHNIDTMIAQVGGNPERLFPHVKTHKMAEVVKMQLQAGIDKFKCATIAEMEMTLAAGAKMVLIAYQMTGPKIGRLLQLAKKYPTAHLSSLVDNVVSAQQLASAFAKENLTANIYLDVNNGMHRTGCPLNEDTFGLIKEIHAMERLVLQGLHVYDGQFRATSFAQRKKAGDLAFRPIYGLVDQVKSTLGLDLAIINGGSPAFTSAAMRKNVFCSPGTVLLWDAGYAEIVPELPAQWAAVLVTRIISKPTEGIVTVDLGHKSVAGENPMHHRVRFLNLKNYEAYKHSEEHLMLKVDNWEDLTVGDVLYGIPFHVCPTVALHEEVHVIRNHVWEGNWSVVARKRKISV